MSKGWVDRRRQVSTERTEADRFLPKLTARTDKYGGYVAAMEACGFDPTAPGHAPE